MARWNTQSTPTDISAFSDNPHLRKQLKRRRRKIIAAVAAVTLVIGLSAWPIYKTFRNHMIGKNLEAAQQAARLKNWDEARNKARSVLLARPGDFEAFRIWTEALGEIGEPRTYLAAAMLFTNPKADRRDKLVAMRIMARQAPEAVALSAYGSLPEETRNEREYLTALAPLISRRGGSEIVIKQLGAAEGIEQDPAARLEVLRALCMNPSPENLQRARGIFAGLTAIEGSDEALEALLILSEVPGGLAPGEPLPRLTDWVEHQPHAKTIHHLLALHPSIEAAPDDATPVYEAAVERFLELDPGVVGTWLVRMGQADLAAQVLKEPAKTRSDAYISYLHALLRTADEDALNESLETPPASSDLVEVEMVRAAMARRRGDQSAESAAWTRALNQAAFDGTQNRFLEVARYASLLNADDASVDAWVGAVRIGWGTIPLYRDLQQQIGVLAGKSRSEDLLAMFRTMLRFEPENPDLLNNFYYLGLLHGLLAPADSRAGLEPLIARFPERTEFKSALAMAYLQENQPAMALDLMPEIRKSRNVAPMMADAIEGTALILADRPDPGTKLLETIQWKAFMRQERLVFREILLRKEIDGLPLPELEVLEVHDNPGAISKWREAVEKLEKARSNDVLPALPKWEPPAMPELPGER